MTARENLLNLTPDDAEARLGAVMAELGQPGYRVGQVIRRLWQMPARSFAEMTELPSALRVALDERFELPRLELATSQLSTDGTRKFLFRLRDGEAIETVAIPDGNRITLCISSQAGCALRCAFCATGAMGFSRNLEIFEIAGQVREMRLLDEPVGVTNIVFMGMGEPLMNWKAVSPTLTLLNDPRALGQLARECGAFVNLIPLHPGGSQGFVPTPANEISRFARLLRDRGVEVAVRKSRGMDIAAACGQLRVERMGRRPPRTADQHGDVQVA